MQYASLAWRVMDGPAHMFEIPSSLADGLMSGMVADTLDGSVCFMRRVQARPLSEAVAR